MKATFGHQTRAPTELINDNTVTLTFSFHSYNHYGNACYSLKSDYSGY